MCTGASGCGEHVLPPDALPGVPIQESPEVSTTYKTASGRVLANGGQQKVQGVTAEGNRVGVKWQVVPGLKQPLLSLGKLTANNHRVVLRDMKHFHLVLLINYIF